MIIGIIVLFIVLGLGLGIYFFMGGEEAPVTAPVEDIEPKVEPKAEPKAEPVSTQDPTPSAALEPAPLKKNYISVASVDYPGNDIKHITNSTIADCQAECDKDPQCTMVTMDNAGKLCWLKSTAKSYSPHGDRVNYFKPDGAWDVDTTYTLYKAGARCTGSPSYASPAWGLLNQGEPKTFADYNADGDKVYRTYITRGIQKCKDDPNCKYVNVWRDAGYRKYPDGQCNSQVRDDMTSVFSK